MSMFSIVNDSLELETEIKIEYIESSEKDPLRESIEEPICIEHESKEVPIYLYESPKPITKATICSLKLSPADRKLDENSFESFRRFNPDEILDVNSCDKNLQQDKQNSIFESIESLGRFVCNLCDISFSGKPALRKHFRLKHSNYLSIFKTMAARKLRGTRSKCHICLKSFKTLSNLQKHVDESHDIVKLHNTCYYCNATFDNQDAMSNHILIMHGKVYKNILICMVCGYRTLKTSHFKQHKNTHFQEKTYACPYCDYKGNYTSNYNSHLKIHNENQYYCKFEGCEYSCKSRSGLIGHQLKHNPQDKMNYCDKCNYKTVYKSTFKKHQKCHTDSIVIK